MIEGGARTKGDTRVVAVNEDTEDSLDLLLSYWLPKEMASVSESSRMPLLLKWVKQFC